MNNYIPYTYYLYHIPTDKHYYGASYANNARRVANPSNFWKTYFTSSKEVAKLRKQYGDDSFVFQIRKTFKDGEAARIWEAKVLKRMNVVKDDRWLNKTDNKIVLHNVPHSEETKQLIREKINALNLARKLEMEAKGIKPPKRHNPNFTTKGLKYSEETKRKLSEAAKRRARKLHTEETKEKMREAAKLRWQTNPRRPHTEEEKKNLSIKSKAAHAKRKLANTLQQNA